MKTLHTPGPWVLDPLRTDITDSHEPFRFKSGYLRSSNGVPFCSFLACQAPADSWSTPFEELEANARLIAVTPELFDALTHKINGYEPIKLLRRAAEVLEFKAAHNNATSTLVNPLNTLADRLESVIAKATIEKQTA